MNQRGYSLIEVMVGVSIVGVLSVVGVQTYQKQVTKAKITSTLASMHALKNSIMAARVTERKVLGKLMMTYACVNCGPNGNNNLGNTEWIAPDLYQWNKIGYSKIPVDAWGKPLILDANELEFNDCRKDTIWSFGPDQIWQGFTTAGGVAGDDLLVEIPYYKWTPEDCPNG